MNGCFGYYRLGRSFLLNDRDNRLAYGLFGVNLLCLLLHDRRDRLRFRLHRLVC